MVYRQDLTLTSRPLSLYYRTTSQHVEGWKGIEGETPRILSESINSYRTSNRQGAAILDETLLSQPHLIPGLVGEVQLLDMQVS